ncbi:hypothetical protein vseg_021699 [Gypsophila vaccaria]
MTQVRSNSTTSINGTLNGDVTVPILREGEEPLPKHHAKPHCVAIVRTNTNKKFYGSNALPSLNQPKVQGAQWSSARIKLSNGGDSIEAGWMVYPSIFKDNEAHLYAKFKAGPVECLNTDCPGFVEKSQDTPLGSYPSGGYSTYGGQQYVWDISINKHKDDGNWWLTLTLPTIGVSQVGYWPGSLFTSLKDFATQVEWGGEIDDPDSADPPPSMGNGSKAVYDQTKSAFFQRVTVVDENFNKVIPDGTEKYYDCEDLYTTLDMGDQGGDKGRIIFFGGYDD